MINEDIDILSLDNKIKLHFESEVQKYKRYNERLLCIENILKIENLRPKILLDLLMDKKYLEKFKVCVSGTRDPLFIQELKNRGFVLSDNITKKVKVLIVKNSNEETTKVKKSN